MKRYNGETLSVYLSILASPSGIRQKEIALITNMKSSHVSRSVKTLENDGHIFRDSRLLKVTKHGNLIVTKYGNKTYRKVTDDGNKTGELVTKYGNIGEKKEKLEPKKPPGEFPETPVLSPISRNTESGKDESTPENLQDILFLKNSNSNELNKKTIKKTKDYNSYSDDIKSVVNLFISTFDDTSKPKQELKRVEYCGAIEKLLRIDKGIYKIDVITQAIIQGRGDHFWSKQFLSLAKLIRKSESLDMRYIDVFLNLKNSIRPNQAKATWDYHDGGDK